MLSVRVATVVGILLLCACGHSTEPKSEPPPVKETVFGDMVGTMDRAKGVQDTLVKDKEHVDAAIEAESKKQE